MKGQKQLYRPKTNFRVKEEPNGIRQNITQVKGLRGLDSSTSMNKMKRKGVLKTKMPRLYINSNVLLFLSLDRSIRISINQHPNEKLKI